MALKKKTRETMAGVAFISPWIIGFLAFQLYPIFRSLYLSFTNFTLVKTPDWIGLSNYILLFEKDKNFTLSLGNTFYQAGVF